MLGKLAFRNVKRQASSYIIYFITVVFTVALMFAVNNILLSKKLLGIMVGRSDLTGIAVFFIIIITLVVGFIICYATAFLLRKRKKEFGTYLLLGIGRTVVLKIFVIENLIIGALSFLLGCLLGLGVFQILNSVVCAIIGSNFGPLNYAPSSIWVTLLQWALIFAAAIAYSGLALRQSKIADLVKEKALDLKLPSNRTVRKAFTLTMYWIIAAITVLEIFFIIAMAGGAVFNEVFCCTVPPLLIIALAAAVIAVPKKPAVEKIIGLAMPAVIAAVCFLELYLFSQRFGSGAIPDWLENDTMVFGLMAVGLAILISAIFIFHFFSRGFYSSRLDKPKKLKGSNVFHYRQMSSALSRNAAIMGTLGVLLSIAVFFSSFSYSIRYVQIEEVNQYIQFDIIGVWQKIPAGGGQGYGNRPGDVIREAEKYTAVTFSREYGIYNSVLRDTPDWFDQEIPKFALIKQNDINALMRELGRPGYAVADDGFCVLYTYLSGEGRSGLEAGDTVSIFGRELKYEGQRYEKLNPFLCATEYSMIVVPDAIASDSDWEIYLDRTVLAMNTKDHLPRAFYDAAGWNIDSRYLRLEAVNSSSLIMIVSALYLGIAFMFIAMALLSLKVMADADLDKRRYSILNMLGVSAGRQRKILFRQVMAFFAAPMLIPLLIAVPSTVFSALLSLNSLGFVPPAIYWIGAAVPLIFAGIYSCYFAATYYLSVKNSIKSLEKPRIRLLADK